MKMIDLTRPKMLARGQIVLLCALICAALLCCTVQLARAADTASASGIETPARHPHPIPMPADADVDRSITRGVDFLLSIQNRDGSWGSATQTKDLNIYAPVPGAHEAFRAAVTALCISALIESHDARPAVSQSLDRGEKWLLEKLPQVRRAEQSTLYNNWAHAYGIEALCRMLKGHAGDAERQQSIKAVIRQQIDRLTRYEYAFGGWGYYDFESHTDHPGEYAPSFTSSTVLVALKAAERAGVEVPKRLTDRGTAAVQSQQKPDFTYLYSGTFWKKPMRGINQPGGSLGRSQVCNLALRDWGDKRITDAVLTECLDRLFARNMWLDIGRKRPIPHESYYQVAGYFYYYGHYYAAECIAELPAAERPRHTAQLDARLMALQEKDGSWWDYPLYNYHQQYGTAFAVMSLAKGRIAK
ncbi:MAG: hypothetical protein K8T25_09185 [Planctomycetia bacterium]|nr:hypothetical protein [Planctomycetia bacterium]